MLLLLSIIPCICTVNNEAEMCGQGQLVVEGLLEDRDSELEFDQDLGFERGQLIKSAEDPTPGLYNIVINNNSDIAKYSEKITGNGSLGDPYIFRNNYGMNDTIFVRNLTEGENHFVISNSSLNRAVIYNNNVTIELEFANIHYF